MKKLFPFLCSAVACILSGCAGAPVLNAIHPSELIANPLQLRAALFIPDSIKSRTIPFNPVGACSEYGAKIDVGAAYTSAIQSGLSAAIMNVALVNSKTVNSKTPPSDTLNPYDLFIDVTLANDSAELVSSGNGGMPVPTNVNAQFHTSFTLRYADAKGKTIYSATINDSDSITTYVTCFHLVNPVKDAITKTLQHACDYIALTTLRSAQMKDYAKRVSDGNGK